MMDLSLPYMSVLVTLLNIGILAALIYGIYRLVKYLEYRAMIQDEIYNLLQEIKAKIEEQ